MYQFGFRAKHSTSSALITLVDKITQSLAKGESVLGVFLDLRKAFDTVDHKILLNKLHSYGIRGSANQWFKNYLSNRQQYVVWDQCASQRKQLSFGVPQGSILGPILFLIYINDLAAISPVLFPVLFADDTSVFISGKDSGSLISIMNTELTKLSLWLEVNKLSLNVAKCQHMFFYSRNKKICTSLPVVIKGEAVSRVSTTKFLGVILDEHLNWQAHINSVINKVSKCIGITYKARQYLLQSTLLKLYYALVYPHLSYCIEVWGNTFKSHLHRLEVVQKKIIRIISNSSFNAHSAPLFLDLNVLPLNKIYVSAVLIFMYKLRNNALPATDLFKDMFQYNHSHHQYNTRQRTNVHTPVSHLSLAYRSIRFSGVNLWNSLPDNIKFAFSLSSFKLRLKTYLLQ